MYSDNNQPQTPELLPPVNDSPNSTVASSQNNTQSQPSSVPTPQSAVAPTPVGPDQLQPQHHNTNQQTQVTKAPQPDVRSVEELKKAYAAKAKEILLNNASDPYNTCVMVEKIKHQYLKEVYNKDIKPLQEK